MIKKPHTTEFRYPATRRVHSLAKSAELGGGYRQSEAPFKPAAGQFSRNPIYLAFVLFVLGLSVWLNDLWLVVTLVPVVAIIAGIVIPREERFLERNFPDQYSNYKASVRRWL
jgi:protein-S-isoprenylcysteine O-methyltransferase Ste14